MKSITITFYSEEGNTKKKFSAIEDVNFWNVIREKIYSYAEKMGMGITRINFSGKTVSWQ